MRLRILPAICLLFPMLSLLGCEGTEDKQMSEAQSCLDKATPATANTCLQPIADLSTPESYQIRCAVDFLAQGFTSNRYVSAFKNISTSSGSSGQRPALEAIAFMNFPTVANATQALSDCSASNSDSLRRIAELAQISTTLAAGSYTSTSDSTSVANATDAVTNTDYVNAASCAASGGSRDTTARNTGTEVVTIYNDFCVADTPFSSSDICQTLTQTFAIVPQSSPPKLLGCAFMKAILNSTL